MIRTRPARLNRQLATMLAGAITVLLGGHAVAMAKCGDAPGDAAAIAAVRASIAAQCPCATALSRADYVRCGKTVVSDAVALGTLPRTCAGTVKKCVTKSTCGRPGAVTCCRTTASGRSKCVVKKDATKCRAPSGGTAVVSACPSCCDACTAGCGATNTPVASNTPVPTNTAVANTPASTSTGTQTRTVTPTPTITNTPTIPAICEPDLAITPIAQVPITLGTGSPQCGGAGLMNPLPEPPFSGSVADGSAMTLGNLSVGCLYAGGLPALQLPGGSSALLDVTGFTLLPLSVTMGGSEGTGPTDCTKGAGPARTCANGAVGLDGMGACNFDEDCGGVVTSCALEPNCFFGPPIPVPNGVLSACVMNAFLTDLCGQVTLTPPQATFATALSSRVYLTLDPVSPCPRCEGGLCNGGDRDGLPCVVGGSAGTALECPPAASTFLSTLTVVVPQLTSGVSTLTASDGLFCDGQVAPGAIGLAAARTITESGTAPSLAGTALQMNLAATFCIAPTGTFLDNIVGLPGVGALSAPGAVDIADLLLP
jgi:hypothetical protein